MTSVTFQSGSTANGDTLCVQIDIEDDDIYEENEVFLVGINTITPSSAAMTGATPQATKTIQDNMGRNILCNMKTIFQVDYYFCFCRCCCRVCEWYV